MLGLRLLIHYLAFCIWAVVWKLCQLYIQYMHCMIALCDHIFSHIIPDMGWNKTQHMNRIDKGRITNVIVWTVCVSPPNFSIWPQNDDIPNIIKVWAVPEMKSMIYSFLSGHTGESPLFTALCFCPIQQVCFLSHVGFLSTTCPLLYSHPPTSLASQDRPFSTPKPWLHSWAIPPPPSEQEPSASLSLSSGGCRPRFPFEDVILENSETSLGLS